MSLKVYSDINDPDLKRIWQDLYRNNRFLFPYSSWEYNFWIKKYKGFKPSALLEKDSFIVYSENGIPLIIIPLTIKKGTLGFLEIMLAGLETSIAYIKIA